MLLSEAVKPLFAGGKLLQPKWLACCPVRGTSRSRRLFELRGFQHYRCRDCGFIFVNPRLNDEGARHYYNSPYYRHYCENCERPMSERHGPFCRTLAGELPAFVDHLQRLCPRGRIVDVGSGLGGLLASLPSAIYERVGVEYNEAAAEFARQRYGLRVVRDVSELTAERGAFDLVTSVEVIEHVADPLAYLQDLQRLLRPEGHLVITTPNIDCWDYQLYGCRCRHFCAPSHVNFFSVVTLTRLGARSGLKRTDYWYRGGFFDWQYWWQTRGLAMDCWSPETPTRNTNNLVYRRPDATFIMPVQQPIDSHASEEAVNRQTSATPPPIDQTVKPGTCGNFKSVLALLGKGIAYRVKSYGGQNQMVVVFQKAAR